MNTKTAKLMRRYCKDNDEFYNVIKNQYECVGKEGQKKLVVHMKRYVKK